MSQERSGGVRGHSSAKCFKFFAFPVSHLQFESERNEIMPGALLYQPKPSWRTATAFSAAALIHFAAVAIAAIHKDAPVKGAIGSDWGPETEVTADLSPTDEPNPPPDIAETPLNPIPVDESMFPEANPTPPPVRPQDARFTSSKAKARNTTPGLLTLSSAKIMAVRAPRPEYPYEARRQKLTGSGTVVMTVASGSGSVTDVAMEQSTGSPFLDNAALAAFRRWRFKPGTVSKVKSPITFTMTGAQY